MSSSHAYRVQIHCSKVMKQKISQFAIERGLSESSAARQLIEIGVNKSSDEIVNEIDSIRKISTSILHAAIVARVVASEAARASGVEIDAELIKVRTKKLLDRYQQRERASI